MATEARAARPITINLKTPARMKLNIRKARTEPDGYVCAAPPIRLKSRSKNAANKITRLVNIEFQPNLRFCASIGKPQEHMKFIA
jgi:hypothetical protein